MLYREYEEQYFDELNKITQRGYCLKDTKVGLDRRLHINLNSELPMLRASYVSIVDVTKYFYTVMEAFDVSRVLKELKTVKYKPITLYLSRVGIVKNISCLVDVENKATFSVVMGYVDWVKELPYIVPALTLMCKWLLRYSDVEAGNLHVLVQFAQISTKNSKLKEMWGNYCQLCSYEHPYKRHAIVTEFVGTENDFLVDILNYIVGTNAYPTVEDYNYKEMVTTENTVSL